MKFPSFVLLCVAAFTSAGVGAETEAQLAARAAALHARIFTIDTHLDTPTLSLVRPDWDIAERHERDDASQVDFPRMRDGGLKSGVFAVFLEQGPRTPAGYARVRDSALRAFLRVHAAASRHPQLCGIARTADEAERLFAAGKLALLLSIENGYAIGKDLTLLKTYQELGARFFGMVHNGNNDLADSSQPEKTFEWNGLSPLGREVVAECNRLGLVIDGSHASDETLRQLLALSKTPVVLTHSNCKALCEHKRNVDDELLRALAAQGGVIHLSAVQLFTAKLPPDPELTAVRTRIYNRAAGREVTDLEAVEIRREYYRVRWQIAKTRATLDDFVKQLLHAIKVAGVDHVGIGSDMDGGGGLVGMDDVDDYPKITLALLKHGLSEQDVAKVWGGNTLRVLRAAEAFADSERQRERARPAAAKAATQ